MMLTLPMRLPQPVDGVDEGEGKPLMGWGRDDEWGTE
jgi:hypothetical protein